MADDRIRIDALPVTVLPSLQHLIPAMREGQTVQLTLAQVQAIMLLGADNAAIALKDLSNTVGPRGALGKLMLAADNYNTLQEMGVWTFPPGGVNAPEATAAYTVRVERSTTGYVIQYARQHTLDGPSDSKLYRREYDTSTWTSWVRVRETEAELDGRYNIPAGAVMAFDRTTAPTGWLKGNGALLLRTSYPALDTAIYCGDANNPTAEWGYRTNSTDTVRSTTGTHVRLRDYRGEFIRGLDDGRGVDSGRSLWAAQAQAVQTHGHNVSDLGHAHNNVGGGSVAGSGVFYAGQASNTYVMGGSVNAVTGITIPSTGNGPETRPRNQAALICIKY